MKETERISIKYIFPVKDKDGKKLKIVIGHQVPGKALYLHAFQQTVLLGKDIKPQLKRILKDLPSWVKGNNKIAYCFLSPRQKKNGVKKNG